MVSLRDGILSLYPSAKIGATGPIILACEPDRGEYIVQWDDTLGPQPTVAECLAAPAPAPSPVPYETAIQAHLDSIAQSWGYDDIKSAASYVGDPDEQFNAEGTALRNWRSATWRAGYQLLASHASDATPPTIEAVIAALPAVPARPL